ncbi:MAG: alpha/beta fold hydrolase [Candidatus Rokubacteria bacterium]|nr:alpha/beta fold hydrolase [Candidatus Rokubacteria bacterium]
MRALLWLAIACGALVAISLWTFWMAVRPPRLSIPGTPSDYRLKAEELTLTTADGVKLAAWLIPSAKADSPAVVVLHGYPANKADLLPIAGALSSRFTVLLVDFRSFGSSEGSATTLGFRERADLRAAVDALAQRGHTRIGVFGYSLGGAVALLGAAEDPRIRAVAAWAPFADLRVLARELYAIFWLLKYPFVELMIVWGRLFLGADITRPSPEMAVAQLTIPVQIWASRDDDQIPFAHAERLQRALANNPRAEFQFGRGLHNDRAQDFERLLGEFFARTL